MYESGEYETLSGSVARRFEGIRRGYARWPRLMDSIDVLDWGRSGRRSGPRARDVRQNQRSGLAPRLRYSLASGTSHRAGRHQEKQMKHTLIFTSSVIVAALSIAALPANAQARRNGGHQGGGGHVSGRQSAPRQSSRGASPQTRQSAPRGSYSAPRTMSRPSGNRPYSGTQALPRSSGNRSYGNNSYGPRTAAPRYNSPSYSGGRGTVMRPPATVVTAVARA